METSHYYHHHHLAVDADTGTIPHLPSAHQAVQQWESSSLESSSEQLFIESGRMDTSAHHTGYALGGVAGSAGIRACGEMDLAYPTSNGSSANSPWTPASSISPRSDTMVPLPPPSLHIDETGHLGSSYSSPECRSPTFTANVNSWPRLYPAPPSYRRQTVLKAYPHYQEYAPIDHPPILAPGYSYSSYDQSVAHHGYNDVPTSLSQLSYDYTHALSTQSHPHTSDSNLHLQHLYNEPLDAYTLPAPLVFDFQRSQNSSQSSASDQSIPSLDPSETVTGISNKHSSDPPPVLRRSTRNIAPKVASAYTNSSCSTSSTGAGPATPDSTSSWAESETEDEDDKEWVPGRSAASKRRTSVARSQNSSSQCTPHHLVSDEEEHTDTFTKSVIARKSRPIPLPLPVPIPGLVKKSRGRKVPASEAGEGGGSSVEGTSVEGDSGDDHDGMLPSRKRRRDRNSNGSVDLQRSYQCKVNGCGKGFVRSEHLKRHVRSIHTYEKPHRCPFAGCGKGFSRKDNLGQHYRVHLG